MEKFKSLLKLFVHLLALICWFYLAYTDWKLFIVITVLLWSNNLANKDIFLTADGKNWGSSFEKYLEDNK